MPETLFRGLSETYLHRLASSLSRGTPFQPPVVLHPDDDLVRDVVFWSRMRGLDISAMQEQRARARRWWEEQPQPEDRLSDEVRRAVFERDDYRCVHCGERYNITVDHIYPRAKGGPSTLDNLQTLCGPCNSRKRDRT